MKKNVSAVICARWFVRRRAQFRWSELMTEAIRRVGERELQIIKHERFYKLLQFQQYFLKFISPKNYYCEISAFDNSVALF